MRNQFKFIIGFALAFVIFNVYAIQVYVKTLSNDVAALGFTINGKNYGGMGKSYIRNNAPAGSYTFGVRVGGIFGDDVGCMTAQGKDSIMINGNTTAILTYKGKQCTVKVINR